LVAVTTFTEWAYGVGFFVSTGTLVFTLYKYLEERRAKWRLADEKRILTDEMRQIRRRGRAPFFRPTFLHVPPQGEAGNQIFHPGQEVIPVFTAKDVRLTLILANDGEEVRNSSDDWPEGEGFIHPSWGIKHDGNSAIEFTYCYDPSKHGQPMRIKISFETLDGLQLDQTYETRHGFCEFRRVDPE